MTRDDLRDKVLADTSDHLVLSMGTGIGKTRFSLDKINQWFKKDDRILIVVPRLVLIDNWIEEIKKFHYEKFLIDITFSTYVSLPKQMPEWDIVVFDEAHHLSERCREAIDNWKIKHSISLSATLNKEVKWYLNGRFNRASFINMKTGEAISNAILPKPNIILIPLSLDNSNKTVLVPKNSKSKDSAVIIPYESRWRASKTLKNYQILCTQKQAYELKSEKVEWYKNKAMGGTQVLKNLWLQAAGERLKWLADQKVPYTKKILSVLGRKRTLMFCSSINQSELFGKCVNSKEGTANLELFNQGKINRITAVAMVDEGITLTNCQVGLFNMLNSSDKLICQRVGRILRHENPIIILPFFKDTREEEIVDKIVSEYDSDLITRLASINSFNESLL